LRTAERSGAVGAFRVTANPNAYGWGWGYRARGARTNHSRVSRS